MEARPLHPTVRTFAMCTIASKGMTKVLSRQGQGKYKTKADTGMTMQWRGQGKCRKRKKQLKKTKI